MRRFLAPLACLAFVAGALVSPLFADEKPPLTKEQEREKFHPRRLGMDAETRLAGWARRQQMEKES
ncbi:MAG TPA: hypothetical protein VEO37_09660, partial [Thermoanaerobaculia bacterium]|nr:hypothetical protein [Thermoanaerobaculia bacterium]